jgi:hypothetical protein
MLRLAKAVFVVLALTSTAWAESVTFTGGTASARQAGAFDMGAVLTGQNTSVAGTRPVAFPLSSLTTGNSFFSVLTFTQLLNGVQYAPSPQNGSDLNLLMGFVHEPVPASILGNSISDTPGLKFSSPFTMTGTLFVRDLSTNQDVLFNVSGQGTLNVSKVEVPLSAFPFINVDFNFAPVLVPEGSSLSLLVGAFGFLVVLVKRANRTGKPSQV